MCFFDYETLTRVQHYKTLGNTWKGIDIDDGVKPRGFFNDNVHSKEGHPQSAAQHGNQFVQ